MSASPVRSAITLNPSIGAVSAAQIAAQWIYLTAIFTPSHPFNVPIKCALTWGGRV